MLIEDGKSMYLVSDDPKMIQYMKALEEKYGGNTAEIQELPLAPLEHDRSAENERESKSSNTDLTDKYKALEMKEKELISIIALYIKAVKEDSGLSYEEKIVKFTKDIPDFVRPIYREIVRGKGYNKLKDLLNDSNQDMSQVFDEILERLRDKVKSYRI